MGDPATNLLVFAAATAALVLLRHPRGGLAGWIRRRRRRYERVLVEDALKYLHGRDERGDDASLGGVAGALGIGGGRALDLVGRMQTADLVEVEGGQIGLSEAGRRYARQVIRAHRLWERYLADETDLSPHRWHTEAERREHTLSVEDAERLARRLGDPRYDPHGDPIPTADGELPAPDVVPLTALEPGARAVVAHVEDEPEAVYGRLVALGIHPGMGLRVTARTPEAVAVEVDGTTRLVPVLLAANVHTRPGAEAVETVPAPPEGTRPLSDLPAGSEGVVAAIDARCRGAERRRVMDLGVVPGTHVVVERRAPGGGLTAYRLRGTVIALRDSQARMIRVRPGPPDPDPGEEAPE